MLDPSSHARKIPAFTRPRGHHPADHSTKSNLPMKKTRIFPQACAPVLFLLVIACPLRAVEVATKDDVVSIGNKLVRVDYNLKTATYNIVDARDGTLAIANAHSEADGIGGNPEGFFTRRLDPAAKLTWAAKETTDELGRGKTLTVNNLRMIDGREFLTTFTLHDDKGFVVLGSGIVNHRGYGIRLKSFQPLVGGDAFPGLEMKDPKNLNGGAGSTHNLVKPGTSLACENSLLLTFTANAKRHSLVMGGLSYQDFAKYTALGNFECWDNYPNYWHHPELGRTWCTIWQQMDGDRMPKNFPKTAVQVAALDPVGRLVDPGTTYQPNDLFYVDVTTADPFVALETYGMAMRLATKARPNTYNNLTVCGWFSGRKNDKALVEEMDTLTSCRC